VFGTARQVLTHSDLNRYEFVVLGIFALCVLLFGLLSNPINELLVTTVNSLLKEQ